MSYCCTCQDGHQVLDEFTGLVVPCPECCRLWWAHDCADYQVEVGEPPARNGAFRRWTECQVCGQRLDTPTWDWVL